MAGGKRLGAIEVERADHPHKKARVVFPLDSIEQPINIIKNEWQAMHAKHMKLLDNIGKLEHVVQTSCMHLKMLFKTHILLLEFK